MDYLTLGKLDKEVPSVLGLNGASAIFTGAWRHY